MIVMMITNLQEVLRGRSSATKVFAEKNHCYLDLPSSFAIIVLHIICHHYPPFPTIGSHNNCHHHHQSLTCLSYRWWLWHCFQGTCRTGFSELLKHNGFALDADVESLVTLFRSTKAHGRTPYYDLWYLGFCDDQWPLFISCLITQITGRQGTAMYYSGVAPTKLECPVLSKHEETQPGGLYTNYTPTDFFILSK